MNVHTSLVTILTTISADKSEALVVDFQSRMKFAKVIGAIPWTY